jgi:2'-5' RNA ligase
MLAHVDLPKLVSSTQPINLFFAIMPDLAAREQAHGIARQHCVDRRMSGIPLRVDRLHVTLLSVGGFVGVVPNAFMDAALGIGDSVTLSSFRMTFDRAVSFARSTGKRPYVLLGNEDVGEAMHLHCGLVSAMWRQGLDMPIRSRFNPHMTLAYDFEHHAEMPVEPVSWTAREFVLIESHVGQTRHIVRGRWPLR